MTAPCKNCPYRAIGCHSYCEPYKTYKTAKAQANERRMNDQEVIDAIIKGNIRRSKPVRDRRK